jgi:hypothetical protein
MVGKKSACGPAGVLSPRPELLTVETLNPRLASGGADVRRITVLKVRRHLLARVRTGKGMI